MTRIDEDLKGYSCLPCRQRKVKCDRRAPCAHCTKTEKECSFVAPVRGKRKRTKLPKEGLHAKLKRYEELLKSYGAKIEVDEDGEESDDETASPADVDMEEDVGGEATRRSTPAVRKGVRSDDRYSLEELEDTAKLVTKGGTSRYYDSTLWSIYSLENNNQPPDVETGEALGEPNIQETEIFLADERTTFVQDLPSLLLPAQMIPNLREIYEDRVDPLTKILHLPTFCSSLTEAVQHPKDMSKPFQALAFAVYLATISSMEDRECLQLFGTSKSVMFSRYRAAARQALVNSRFLSTSSPTTLRAYAIFLNGVRNEYRSDTLFILSGIAIRLARKMGLHRDGASLGLSPFETEMRRRLWWNLVHVDYRTADLLGTRPSMDLSFGDTKPPANNEDDDFHPDMLEAPPERTGITSIASALIRCDIIETLRGFSSSETAFKGDIRWEALCSSDIPASKKDRLIAKMEDSLETKYLRYCDPSNAYHTFVSVMIRCAICKMKLFAHNPRRHLGGATKVPQAERDIIFANATKLLEYATLLQGPHRGCLKYMWQLGTSYLWNTLLFVLIEMRHRKTGPEVDRTWQLVGLVLEQYPRVFEEAAGTVYTALGKWTLEVWDEYVEAAGREGRGVVEGMGFIGKLRRLRRASTSGSGTAGTGAPGRESGVGAGRGQMQRLEGMEREREMPVFDSFEEFPDLLSFEVDPNGWSQWEQILAEEGGLVQGGSI
ncbi:putative C6 transcription factor [Aulographum hederae CBS 113979]|uniref:Putative C6 transcription factor n=1 Tax=Aulographum hederae CBS 113979 TaxID=1176131 RepID=A0A6G1GNE8_9PEZI|nr:putative C6 transcription factor [Aulographum hederae CBS 113979]